MNKLTLKNAILERNRREKIIKKSKKTKFAIDKSKKVMYNGSAEKFVYARKSIKNEHNQENWSTYIGR